MSDRQLPMLGDAAVERDRNGHADESVAGQRDPYAMLDAHVIRVRALYCEDGCGLVDTSIAGVDDQGAAGDLAERGWVVRPHSMGGLTALCKDCAARYDARVLPTGEEQAP